MCMLLKERDAAPKIAKKDIVCYKVCQRHRSKLILTLFRGQAVNIGKTYTSEIRLMSSEYFRYGIYNKIYSIDIGLHSFKSIDTCLPWSSWENSIVIKCVIPKGSSYYNGSSKLIHKYKKDSYVSNVLKYVEIVKDVTKNYGT